MSDVDELRLATRSSGHYTAVTTAWGTAETELAAEYSGADVANSCTARPGPLRT